MRHEANILCRSVLKFKLQIKVSKVRIAKNKQTGLNGRCVPCILLMSDFDSIESIFNKGLTYSITTKIKFIF